MGHLTESGDPECDFDFNTVKILDSARPDYKLRFTESIWLKYEKQSLNNIHRNGLYLLTLYNTSVFCTCVIIHAAFCDIVISVLRNSTV